MDASESKRPWGQEHEGDERSSARGLVEDPLTPAAPLFRPERLPAPPVLTPPPPPVLPPPPTAAPPAPPVDHSSSDFTQPPAAPRGTRSAAPAELVEDPLTPIPLYLQKPLFPPAPPVSRNAGPDDLEEDPITPVPFYQRPEGGLPIPVGQPSAPADQRETPSGRGRGLSADNVSSPIPADIRETPSAQRIAAAAARPAMPSRLAYRFAPSPQPVLLAIFPDPGARFEIEQDATITIGRDPRRNDLVLLNSSVSQRHCQISCEDDDCTVTDLGSSNGTFVNGERIQGPQHLRQGDLLNLGRYVFMFLWHRFARFPRSEVLHYRDLCALMAQLYPTPSSIQTLLLASNLFHIPVDLTRGNSEQIWERLLEQLRKQDILNSLETILVCALRDHSGNRDLRRIQEMLETWKASRQDSGLQERINADVQNSARVVQEILENHMDTEEHQHSLSQMLDPIEDHDDRAHAIHTGSDRGASVPRPAPAPRELPFEMKAEDSQPVREEPLLEDTASRPPETALSSAEVPPPVPPSSRGTTEEVPWEQPTPPAAGDALAREMPPWEQPKPARRRWGFALAVVGMVVLGVSSALVLPSFMKGLQEGHEAATQVPHRMARATQAPVAAPAGPTAAPSLAPATPAATPGMPEASPAAAGGATPAVGASSQTVEFAFLVLNFLDDNGQPAYTAGTLPAGASWDAASKQVSATGLSGCVWVDKQERQFDSKPGKTFWKVRCQAGSSSVEGWLNKAAVKTAG